MLQVIDLAFGYGEKPLYQGVNFIVGRGQKVGLIGPNGSGKSTLLKIIAGTEKSYEGEVVFSPGYSVGMLEQDPKLDNQKTVREIVEEGTAEVVALLKEYEDLNMKFAEPMTDDEMNKLIERQGELTELLDHHNAWELDNKLERAMDALRCPPSDWKIENLSGGERRRVAFCAILCYRSRHADRYHRLIHPAPRTGRPSAAA